VGTGTEDRELPALCGAIRRATLQSSGQYRARLAITHQRPGVGCEHAAVIEKRDGDEKASKETRSEMNERKDSADSTIPPRHQIRALMVEHSTEHISPAPEMIDGPFRMPLDVLIPFRGINPIGNRQVASPAIEEDAATSTASEGVGQRQRVTAVFSQFESRVDHKLLHGVEAEVTQ
jgi:hypothetical protein